MSRKSYEAPPLKPDKDKMVIKVLEPKIRIPKELRERAFKRKAGPIGKRKSEELEKIIKKEIKRLSD